MEQDITTYCNFRSAWQREKKLVEKDMGQLQRTVKLLYFKEGRLKIFEV
jgi:hypothetical protein